MKTRNGFVSNSSSSSFIIYIKDENMSFEELKAKTINAMENYCASFDDADKSFNINEAEKIAKEGRYMALKKRVEWGGEEAINDLLPKIFELFNIDQKNITYEWGE
jgi:hypothetical protein